MNKYNFKFKNKDTTNTLIEVALVSSVLTLTWDLPYMSDLLMTNVGYLFKNEAFKDDLLEKIKVTLSIILKKYEHSDIK